MELRQATFEDLEALEPLIAISARTLGSLYYRSDQIEAALLGAFGVDTEIVRDGTYFLIEANGLPLACGGWSRREKPWGGDAHGGMDSRLLDPLYEPARIRAFFVHPDFARQGLATRLLERCEHEALERGFKSCELTATLPGAPFYSAREYVAGDPFEVDLGGTAIEFVPMRRSLV